jgi:hypothetical protein
MYLITLLILISIFTFVIGSSYSILISDKKIDSVKSLLLGMAIIIIIGRYCSRTSIPIEISKYILIVLFLIISIFLITKKYKFIYKDFYGILGAFPLLFIILFPVLNEKLFIFHYGPDLMGNLISSSYLLNKGSFAELAGKYIEIIGHSDWWFSARHEPWVIANMTDSIAIEFFLRSVRWGHAAYTTIISSIFNINIGYSLLILMFLSAITTSILIYKQLNKNLIDNKFSIVISLILLSAQHYVVMVYEGINIQFIVMPFIIYIVINYDKLSNKKDFNESIIYGLLLSTLMTTFGEGVQLIGVFFVIDFLLICIKDKTKIKTISYNLSYIIVTVMFSGPMFIFDFITWTINRLNDGFGGGILHYTFNILDLFLELPIYKITSGMNYDSIKISELTPINNNFILISLLIFGIFEFWKNNNKILISSVLIVSMVLLTGHKYALWKTVVIFQIPVFLSLITSYRSIIFKFDRYLIIIFIIIYGILQISNLRLIKQYMKNSEFISSDEINITDIKLYKNSAILTPSKKFRYLNIANYGEFIWINGGFRQFGLKNIPSSIEKEYDVYLYFDCNIEAGGRCEEMKNKKNIHEKIFIKTNYKVKDFIDKDEIVDIKVNEKIKEIFGVDAK